MRIKSMRVENFRSVRGATLGLDGLTALVGASGACKTTFLHALLVLQGRLKPDMEDFYNCDTARDIEIAVTFTGLSGKAEEKFAKYLRNGELEAVRVCRHNSGAVESSLHGRAPRNPAFDAVRKAQLARDALAEYGRLRGGPEYSALPKCTARAAAENALDRWEDDNPGKYERSIDNGRFFGFKEAAKWYL